MTFILLVTCGLIVYGIAYCGANTAGPFNLFAMLRDRVRKSSTRDWVKEGIDCQICWSAWISIPVAALMAPDITTGVQLWLASIGIVCAITSLSPE